MSDLRKLSLAVLALSLLCCCAAKPPIPADFGYGEKAVSLHLKADQQLNVYQGLPHALLACVYQLEDPNMLKQLADKREGLYELLKCEKFDSGVTYSQKIILQPGKDEKLTLDRAKGTRYVAVAAGYYNMDGAKMVRAFEVPITVEKESFLSRQKVERIGELAITLEFGPQEIK